MAKTHRPVFANVHFFRGKSKDFINTFVHELKPISLKMGEILYKFGDTSNDIYFISEGRVKLLVDLHEFIYDKRLLSRIKEYERKQVQAMGLIGGGDEQSMKAQYIRAIIKYTEGGYFGDSDTLNYLTGTTRERGRDASCVTENDCTIFVMGLKEIQKIRD